jgi:hypothetical protein
MIGRSRYWFLVLWVGVFAVLAMPGRAGAQAVAMSTTVPVVRINGSTTSASSSSDNTVKLTITRADCKDEKLRFRFAMTVTGYQLGWNLEAWAGRSSSDCSGEFTALPGLKGCWKLGNIPVNNAAATVDYSAAQLLGIETDASLTALAPAAKKILSSCDDMTDTTAGRQTFTVSFFMTWSSAVQGTPAKQPMYYSLTGPNGPTISAVNAADSALEVKWDSIAASLTTDVTYEFYCAPNESDTGCKSSQLEAIGARAAASGSAGASSTSASGSAGAGGASNGGGTTSGGAGGAPSSGGADNAGGTSSAGEAGALSAAGDTSLSSAGASAGSSSGGDASLSGGATTDVAGAAGATSSPTLKSLFCGSVRGKANTSGFTNPNAMPLANDKSYAITVGVRDTYGNLGSLAPYVCQNPREIDTFFEKYREDGGMAGGGICNCDLAGRSRHGLWSVTFGAIGLLSWLRRRRQPPRRRSDLNSSTP